LQHRDQDELYDYYKGIMTKATALRWSRIYP
ncbi:MAG: hypothetical protein RL077_326, partial [Verrucomicrobiota bacterium]